MALRDRMVQLQEAIEERTGYALERRERLDLLEARSVELGATRRELDSLAWTALDYVSGNPQEMKAVERRKLVQKARVVWMKDPQAGAAVDLMNDFVWGRGLQKPKAADPLVQEVIDEAWEDPDNQLVLTSYPAQLAIGTDLSIQSNLFIVVFDDGEDGKVKLGLMDHDTVENVVRDPDNRLRILYFVARHYRQEWDFENDGPKVDLLGKGMANARQGDKGKGEVRYYPHWRNLQDALDDAEAGARAKPPTAPDYKLGEGKVFHIAINRGAEMAFGHPTMDRLLRWYHAYNSFIDARLDIIQAKAAFVMKRKIKGTPNQLAKMAQQAVSRRSALGAGAVDDVAAGPRPASILNENESVEHEDINLDTGAASAMQDGQMIRSQVSAATRFPQSYYGDPSGLNAATATSLELPVLKAVEARQEFFESLVRFFIDRVIERAVDTGRLAPELTEDELASRDQATQDDTVADPQQGTGTGQLGLGEAHEGQAQDEKDTQRDLSYEFKMPNPLRRMLSDVIGAIQIVAQTFDPNNTNAELSRTLLIEALTELEVDDPAGKVEKIFPPGYVDPAVAASQMQGMAPGDGGGGPFGEFGPQQEPGQGGSVGQDGQRHPASNPYGVPMQSRTPEQMQQARDMSGGDGGGRQRAPEGRQNARARLRGELRERALLMERDFPDLDGVVVPRGTPRK